MGVNEDNLDTATWDDIGDAPPCIPDGEYTLKILGLALKEKKDKTGWYINYRVVAQDGPDAGHAVFSMWSLGPDNLWRFKADMKRFGLEVPSGLNALDAIRELIPQINGLVVVGKLGSKVRQVKDEENPGEYKDDPDSNRENTLSRFLGLSI